MTPDDRLRTEQADLTEQVAALTADLAGVVRASEASNADDEHDPEGATIAFERAQLAALLAGVTARLADVVAGLRRVEDGSYGRCEGCGQPIAEARLAARPAARTCIGCAR